MTPKQHQFAREVVLGKSQADAYRSAYDTARMNDNSIRREASRLMDNPNVATTVVELQHFLTTGDTLLHYRCVGLLLHRCVGLFL